MLENRTVETEWLWANRVTGAQLSDNKVHLALKAILSYIGAVHFGLYSFKHATITYLVKMDVPEADIAQAARYRDKSQPSVIGKYLNSFVASRKE
jgi:hypothetical protein